MWKAKLDNIPQPQQAKAPLFRGVEGVLYQKGAFTQAPF